MNLSGYRYDYKNCLNEQTHDYLFTGTSGFIFCVYESCIFKVNKTLCAIFITATMSDFKDEPLATSVKRETTGQIRY